MLLIEINYLKECLHIKRLSLRQTFCLLQTFPFLSIPYFLKIVTSTSFASCLVRCHFEETMGGFPFCKNVQAGRTVAKLKRCEDSRFEGSFTHAGLCFMYCPLGDFCLGSKQRSSWHCPLLPTDFRTDITFTHKESHLKDSNKKHIDKKVDTLMRCILIAQHLLRSVAKPDFSEVNYILSELSDIFKPRVNNSSN